MIFSKWVLASLIPLVIVLCIVIIKKSKGTSILGWNALIFSAFFGVTSFFLEPICDVTKRSRGGININGVIEERIVNSIIIVFLIVLVYLLIIAFQDRQPFQKTVKYLSGKNVFWFGLIFCIFSFTMLIMSPAGQVRMNYGFFDIYHNFTDRNSYYGYRVEMQRAGVSSYVNTFQGIANQIVLPVLSLYSLQRYLLGKNKKWRSRWLIVQVLWIIVAIFGLNKAPFFHIIFTNLVLFVFIKIVMGARIKIILFWIGTCLAVVLLTTAFVFHIAHGTSSYRELGKEMTGRFLDPVITTIAHYQVFPDLHPFTNWSGSTTLHLIFSPFTEKKQYQLSTYELAAKYTWGTPYNMDTGFLGDGWAQNGYIGVAQSALLLFGIFLFWDKIVTKLRNKIPIYALTCFFISSYLNILEGSLMAMLIIGGSILAPSMYLVLFYKEIRCKYSQKRLVEIKNNILSE